MGISARQETLHRHCGRVSPATLHHQPCYSDGPQHRFYEWQQKGNQKLAHFVKPKNGLMLMAGLWDHATCVSAAIV